MGIGDDIMGTGMARGAAARGKRIAFGDGIRLRWGPFSGEAFKNNQNIARSADEPGIEWIHYYKGNRWYNKQDRSRARWIWNYDFSPVAGQFYFDKTEFFASVPGSVLIEPNVPWQKSVAVNKDWGAARYQALADKLWAGGWRVLQTSYGKVRLRGAQVVQVATFRQAAAVLAGVDMAIVPEGGMHHAAAAVNTSAIVIFGGFIPPQVTGYAGHHNLTGGVEACGSWYQCEHCRSALNAIEVDHVYALADTALRQKNSATSGRVA